MKNDDIILRARIDDIFIKLNQIDKDITALMKDEATLTKITKDIRTKVDKLGIVLKLIIPAVQPSLETLGPVYRGGELYDIDVMNDDIEKVEMFIEVLQDTYEAVSIIEEICDKIDTIYSKADKITGGLN